MKKLKQSQIAKELGISKSYLSMILSGKRQCTPELMDRISSQLPVNSKARLSLRERCPKPLDECATKTYPEKSVEILNTYPGSI